MLIIWIRKKESCRADGPPERNREPFGRHDQAMKKFRGAHTQYPAPAPLDIMTTDGNILAPVHHVKLSGCSQN